MLKFIQARMLPLCAAQLTSAHLPSGRRAPLGPMGRKGGRGRQAASWGESARERDSVLRLRAEQDAATAAAAERHAATEARAQARTEAGWLARRGSWAARTAELLRCEVCF